MLDDNGGGGGSCWVIFILGGRVRYCRALRDPLSSPLRCTRTAGMCVFSSALFVDEFLLCALVCVCWSLRACRFVVQKRAPSVEHDEKNALLTPKRPQPQNETKISGSRNPQYKRVEQHTFLT